MRRGSVGREVQRPLLSASPWVDDMGNLVQVLTYLKCYLNSMLWLKSLNSGLWFIVFSSWPEFPVLANSVDGMVRHGI